MMTELGPAYSISATFKTAAAECSPGIETFDRTEPTIAASFRVQVPDCSAFDQRQLRLRSHVSRSPTSRSGSKIPLKKAAGLNKAFLSAM